MVTRRNHERQRPMTLQTVRPRTSLNRSRLNNILSCLLLVLFCGYVWIASYTLFTLRVTMPLKDMVTEVELELMDAAEFVMQVEHEVEQLPTRMETSAHDMVRDVRMDIFLDPSDYDNMDKEDQEGHQDPAKMQERGNHQHPSDAEALLQLYGPDAVHKVLTAYVEGPLQDTVPGTGDRGDLKDDNDIGTEPTFIVPLPLRTQTPNDLTRYEYPQVQTCRDMPHKFPTDRGLQLDADGNTIVTNVGSAPLPPDFAQQEAPYCPIEADPFLPWIHDVFAQHDGSAIYFVAQNKRRCRTGKDYNDAVFRLTPQVTLLQPVSVQRITEQEARATAPQLWQANNTISDDSTPRYRLVESDEAAPDGRATRLICRFHTVAANRDGAVESVVVGETLSQFPFNYDQVSYRKQQGGLLTPKGKDTKLFWTSNLQFTCPVPLAWQEHVAHGRTVLSDGSPALHVDLIPIRTSVRYRDVHLTPDVIGPMTVENGWDKGYTKFNATRAWGKAHVLPRIEASGRWTNIPICAPPTVFDKTSQQQKLLADLQQEKTAGDAVDDVAAGADGTNGTAVASKKPYYLSACMWASATFKTRGLSRGGTTDTMDRLREWLEFHIAAGWDHFYIYDNSGAHTNETSLEPLLSQYPPSLVTRIDWPSAVCNNNIPAHDSTGERSSQYAAENSCRARHAPFTEWISMHDADEYMVPLGDYDDMKNVLRDVEKKGHQILSFRSSRGRLRPDKSYRVNAPPDDSLEQRTNDTTYLEAYNCDSGGSPKPVWAQRAKKQIYKADYVLYHYVHYSTVTKGSMRPYNETPADRWKSKWYEALERNSDELNEAVMIHAKSLHADQTAGYEKRCRYDWEKKWQNCFVAFPWPDGARGANDVKGREGDHDENGMEYNCFINQKVESFWIPKLRARLNMPPLS